MLERWGWFVVRRFRVILGLCGVVAILSVWAYASLPSRLGMEMFVDRGSEAYRGQQLLEEHFGVGVPNLVLIVTGEAGSVDAPEVVVEAEAVADRLAGEDQVSDVVSYWSAGNAPSLRSEDGGRALVVGRILGDDKEKAELLDELVPRYEHSGEAIDVRVGGSAHALRDMVENSHADVKRAELIAGPVTLMALVVVFGSLAAAFLPLLVAAAAVLGTGAVLWMLTGVIEISSFAVWLTTAIGLGLGVDYSLFVVSRFREELAAGHATDVALVRSLRTAGRTVMFSASAVVIALLGLMTFPMNFFWSFGLSGALTAAMAGIGSLVVLPAVLAWIGPGVNRWTVWRRSAAPPSGRGVWYRLAAWVMRRPVPVAALVMVVLLAVALPFLRFNPGLVDDRDLPVGSRSRDTGEILRTEFGSEGAAPLSVVLPGTDPTTRQDDVAAFAARLAGLPHVTMVATTTGQYSGAGHRPLAPKQAARFGQRGWTYLSVLSDAVPLSEESETLIGGIRSLPHRFPEVLVTGEAANIHDVTRSIIGAIPIALAFVVIATGVVLFVQFGSILVPIKAMLMNALSLTVLLGMLVWVFQDGNLSGLLGFTPTGSLNINLPILIGCLAFGLSMDYEVFLLSRIKEEYDRTGDNEASVALGLERSGRIISSAAVLISIVFVTVGLAGSMTFNKEFGYGMAAVVVLDAFVIRGTLMPAFMSLAGAANWWAPRALRRLHDRIGIAEHIDLDEPEPAPTVAV